MSKVLNESMKGKTVVMACGQVSFDENGVAEIADEEFVAELVQLNGYSMADGSTPAPKKPVFEPADNDTDETSTEEKNTQNDAETDENDGQEESSEETSETEESGLTIADLEKKNVAQLKKIAKDNDVDLAGASKKDEIMSIIIGALGLQ